MRKEILFLLTGLFLLLGCAGNSVEKEEPALAYASSVPMYKMYPTKNMWIFLQLNTATGVVEMVQYTVNDGERLHRPVNPDFLKKQGETEETGTYELIPTENFYNFLLHNTASGEVWQLQWGFKQENLMTVKIK